MQQMTQSKKDVMNVPNQLSAIRLLLSVAVFALIPLHFYWAALVIFIIAASTDWVDGWYARKYDQVTQLGRILDPFCDKILICGTYILLAVEMTAVEAFPWYAIIAGWMAVVIVGRELLVTVIRSLVEGSGGDFSAKMAGKLKMWFQCIAVGAALVALALNQQSATPETAELPTWLFLILVGFVWASVISTLHSGWLYVVMARDTIIGKNESSDA